MLLVATLTMIGCESQMRYQASSDLAASPVAPAPRAPVAGAPAGPVSGAKAPRTADALQGSTPPPVAARRKIIYTGSLTLTTTDAEEAMHRVQQEAEQLGGFLEKWETNTVTIRVPVLKFDLAIQRIGKLGSISNKKLSAEDVTDKVRDLDARIANAEAMRARLVELMERTGKMEELLKVEQEIQRITEEMERMQALRLAALDQAAFSTLAVTVREAQPVRKPTYATGMPFSWINVVGADLRSGGGFSRADRKLGKGVTVDLPSGFVRFKQQNYMTIAMSADQVMVKVSRYDNYDEAEAEFWQRLIERHFKKSGLIDVTDTGTLTVRGDKPAVVIEGSRAFGRGDYGYLVAVAVSNDHVYTYEAWGPVEDFTLAKPRLKESIKTLKAGGW